MRVTLGGLVTVVCDHSVFGEDTYVPVVVRRQASRGALPTWSVQIAGGTGIATSTHSFGLSIASFIKCLVRRSVLS